MTVQLSQRGQTGHVQRSYLRKDAEDGRARQEAQREQDMKSGGAEDKVTPQGNSQQEREKDPCTNVQEGQRLMGGQI